MGEFSITHWIIILAIFLIFFGPSRLPQLGQSLGKAIRGFKQGLNEVNSEASKVDSENPKQAQQLDNQTKKNNFETSENHQTQENPTKKS